MSTVAAEHGPCNTAAMRRSSRNQHFRRPYRIMGGGGYQAVVTEMTAAQYLRDPDRFRHHGSDSPIVGAQAWIADDLYRYHPCASHTCDVRIRYPTHRPSRKGFPWRTSDDHHVVPCGTRRSGSTPASLTVRSRHTMCVPRDDGLHLFAPIASSDRLRRDRGTVPQHTKPRRGEVVGDR